MLIDSHCHLGFLELGKNSISTNVFLDKAKQQGVGAVLNIATEPANFFNYINFCSDIIKIYTAIGLHPLYIENNANFTALDITKYLPNNNIIAIGETGFDNYYQSNNLLLQAKLFSIHAEIAIKYKLPLIIHSRCANEITIKELTNYIKNGGIGGVIHCFTGNKDFAKQLLNLGFYISFSGIVTFKNALEIQDALKYVPLDKMLIETDSPYLAPVPMRGKLNTPEYVVYVAKYISNFLNIDYLEFSKLTTNNFCNLFNINNLNNI